MIDRVLDANLNRAREGLRVAEEIARFLLEDAALTRRCQRLRYDVDQTARRLRSDRLIAARDAGRDVGRPARRGRPRRHARTADLLRANLRRTQEALRVLEEFSRLTDAAAARRFGACRFRAYSLEQTFPSRLPPLRHR